MKRIALFVALTAAGAVSTPSSFAASFTYHGVLQDAGKPAQGKYDIQLTLYASPNGGSVVGGPLTLYGVDVNDGSFAADADFGPLAKSFKNAYVGVKVRSAGTGDFTPLSNLEAVTETNTSCPGSWSLDGNAGNPAASYLGTADSAAVVIKAGGVQAARFSSGTQSASVATNFNSNGFASLAVSGGGTEPTASYGFGGGRNGTVNNSGSFVWADTSASSLFQDTAVNQFVLRSFGGVGINTAHREGGADPLDSTLTLAATSGSGLATLKMRGTENVTTSVTLGGLSSVLGTGFPSFSISSHNNDNTNFSNVAFTHNRVAFNGAVTSGALGVGTDSTNGNGASLTNGGVWTNASSRTFKDAFEPVDTMRVLDKVTSMSVQTWLYKNDHDEGRHMGPVAEDFAAAFGLGNDEKHIGSVDESGVAFAAIQGLNKKVEAENAALKSDNAELQNKLDSVLARLSRLESAKGN